MLFLYGCTLGIVAFIFIFGVRVLDVTYVDWLLGKTDPTQHYLGWLAYRQTPWMFPIGLTNALSYPFATSIIYTDSIPLFAVLFKALSPLLPRTFQYFGIWEMVCFALQGGLSAILIHRFVKSKPLCLLGSAFFLLSVPLLMRALYHHEALMAQWILLLAIALWLYKVGESSMKKRCMVWGGIGFLCVSIHLYFVPMIGILLLGSRVTEYWMHKKFSRCLLPIVSYITVCAISLWLFGAFYGGVDVHADGVGAYVSNLNTLVNPLGKSVLFRTLPVIFENYEGSAYLGAGMLVLSVAALIVLFRAGWRNPLLNHRQKAYLLGAVAVVVLCVPIALGPNITLNGRILFTVPYPPLFLSAFGMFRASGRFIWIAFYLLMLVVLVVVLRKLPKKMAYIMLSICVCIQIADSATVLQKLYNEYATAQVYQNPLIQSELMRSFSDNRNYRHIEFLDAFYESDYLQFAEYAVQNNMTVSDFYFARSCSRIDLYRQEELKRVSSGAVSRDTIYVTNRISGIALNGTSLHWYGEGKYAIGVANEIPNQQDKQLSKNMLQVLPDSGRFLNSGEDMPYGRVLHQGGLSYGPYISLRKGVYQVKITGSNLQQCRINVTTNAGRIEIPLSGVVQLVNSIEFSFVLKEDAMMCEFLLENAQEKDIVIESMELSSQHFE